MIRTYFIDTGSVPGKRMLHGNSANICKEVALPMDIND